MSPILREFQVAADDEVVERIKGGFVHRFDREAYAGAELYLRPIRESKFKTSDTGKVFVLFIDVVNNGRLRLLSTVFNLTQMNAPFDFATYHAADERGRRRMVVEELHHAILWLAERKGWDTAIFEHAAKKAAECDYVFEGISKASWASPDGKHRAKIAFRFEGDRVHFEAVLLRRGKEIARRRLGTAPSGHDVLSYYLKHGRWLSPTMFGLKSASFIRENWQIDLTAEMAAAAKPRPRDP